MIYRHLRRDEIKELVTRLKKEFPVTLYRVVDKGYYCGIIRKYPPKAAIIWSDVDIDRIKKKWQEGL